MTAIFPHSENPELAKLREQNRQLIAENERRSAEVAFLLSQINAASVGVATLNDALHSLHSTVRLVGGAEQSCDPVVEVQTPPCNDNAATATLHRRDADPSSSTIAAAPVD